MALRYLTLVMEQDLAARLQAHSEWGSPRWAGDEAVAGRRKALLQNSLTWRILDCSVSVGRWFPNRCPVCVCTCFVWSYKYGGAYAHVDSRLVKRNASRGKLMAGN